MRKQEKIQEMLRKVENRKSKAWFVLDNAAKIYPAANTKRWSGMYRLSVRLKDLIRPDKLQEAVAITIKRFPSFNIRMRKGVFWYYFESNATAVPVVMPDINNPCTPIRWKDNNGFLIRIFYYDKRIAIDYFHSITDGTGAMCFLKTLVAVYLRLNGVSIPATEGVLDVNSDAAPGESEDAFKKYANSKHRGRITQHTAYHLKGTKMPLGDLGIISGIMSLSELKTLAKQNGATLTEYLSALLLYSFYVKKQEKEPDKKPTWIAVSIPVNCRNYFKTETKRNFSLYLDPGIDTIMGEYTFKEILEQIQYYMKANLNAKTLNAMMTQNVRVERNIVIRILPLFIKNFFMLIAHKTIGYKFITSTISNLGIVKVPKEMEPYVERFEFIMGASKIFSQSVGVLSYKDTLVISFTSGIEETDIERNFFTNLIKEGIQVKIESNKE